MAKTGGRGAAGGREVLVEIRRVGSYLRATATDPATLTEVVVVGPINAEAQLRRTVLAKLDYVLSKR